MPELTMPELTMPEPANPEPAGGTPVSASDADEVEIWRIPLDSWPDPEGYPPELEDILDDAEKERARRGTEPGMRRRFVIAHAALRIILGERLGRAPESVRLTRGRWGKPRLAQGDGPHFSLSHSGELALLALAPRPVGVDVERPRAGLDPARLAERFFPAEESAWVARDGRRAFARLWTRKEACVKAAGGRLAQGMALPVGRFSGQAAVRDPTGSLPGTWRVQDVPLTGAYAGAVALLGDGPFSVSLRMWYHIPPEQSGSVWNTLGVK
ncbi:4'-phosphopantetheinyl transferase [Streptomyces hygroscopicus subsp. jinggangensis 5008]|nr:4'-phosphopantetheinyl transferase [Streptomyces hygroscopicus subsp. jinggangensis 5008]AGF65349.1 4'-phosphopantetheinyl transferase [Streptomyces hygroscopicus subsp. jinggangensis TL01]